MSTQAEQTNELVEMQGRTERTITVEVIARQVAENDGGEKVEVGVPRKVFIRPMPMRRWVVAMSYLSAVLGNLPETGINLENPMQMAFLAMHILGKIPNEVFGLLELATDMDAEFYDHIDLDDGVKIVTAVIEVNKDFFVQKVLPMLSEVAPMLKEKVGSTFGQTQ